MNVSLTPALERFVQEKVHSGRYTSASEVVREALRLLEEHEKVRAVQLAEFREEIDRRLASLDHGEGLDGRPLLSVGDRQLELDAVGLLDQSENLDELLVAQLGSRIRWCRCGHS